MTGLFSSRIQLPIKTLLGIPLTDLLHKRLLRPNQRQKLDSPAGYESYSRSQITRLNGDYGLLWLKPFIRHLAYRNQRTPGWRGREAFIVHLGPSYEASLAHFVFLKSILPPPLMIPGCPCRFAASFPRLIPTK